MNIDGDIDQMRSYILLAEALEERGYIAEEIVETEPEVAADPGEAQKVILMELHDLAEKMRAFMETEGGEFALGVETGMQRAADMVENLIRRHTPGEDSGS